MLKGMSDFEQQTLSFSQTINFSCIPFPGNVRAFALHFLYKQHPEIIAKVPNV
jgi:hypothetical protein